MALSYYEQDATNLNQKNLVDNQDFINDAFKYLRERKGHELSDLRTNEQIYRAFVRHMRDADVNEWTAVNDYTYVNELNNEGKARVGRLYTTWDRMDGGGTSFWQAVGDYGVGVATAPSTYIGLITGGTAKLFGFGGAVAARLAAREAAVGALRRTMVSGTRAITARLPQDVVRRRTLTGALGAGLTEGVAGGIRGTAAEGARYEADITGERGFNVAAPLLEAGAGAVGGAAVGAGLGRLLGGRQRKALSLVERAMSAKASRMAEAEKAAAETAQTTTEKKTFTKLFNHIRKTGYGKDPIPEDQVLAGLAERIARGPADSEEFVAGLRLDPGEKMQESVQYRIAGAAMEIFKTAMKTKDNAGQPILKSFDIDLETDRITVVLSKLLRNAGDSDQKSQYLSNLLQKYDLTLEQFTNLYVAELSNAGRTLGLQSTIARNAIGEFTKSIQEIAEVPVTVTKIDPSDPTKKIKVEEYVQLSPDAEAFVKAMEKGADTTDLFRRLASGVTELDKFFKGMMTIQPATTMRNLENATVRSAMYIFTNLLQGSLDVGAAAIRRGATRGNSEAVEAAFKDGMQRMQMPVTFLKNLFDPSQAQGIQQLFASDMPNTYRYLFRSMADIEGSLRGGKLTGFARKLNALNTYVDNSFKRALFIAELGQRVGRKQLLKLSEEGRFNEIPLKDIQSAMDEALDFTYQTRFRGPGKTEEGVLDFNVAADTFIKIFSVPIIGSGFVVYPRFVASMVKHNFQYAPFIGALPLERLGIRTKVKAIPPKILAAMKAKNVTSSSSPAFKTLTPEQRAIIKKIEGQRKGAVVLGSGRSVSKIVAQQSIGFSLLYGAIQLRAAQGPGAEWYELKKIPMVGEVAQGRYSDAKAFYGVYAPYMLMADLILKSTNFFAHRPDPITGEATTGFDPRSLIANKENEKQIRTMAKGHAMELLDKQFFRDFMQSMFGVTFRAGQGLYLVDAIAKSWQTGATTGQEKSADWIADKLSSWVANYLVRPVVPFGFVKDMLGVVDPAFRVIPEKADINPYLMGAYGDALRNAIGIVTRPLPIKEGKLFGQDWLEIEGFGRASVSAQTTRLLETTGATTKHISGIGGGRHKNILMTEMTRLNIPSPWRLFKRYDAPMLDRIARKISGAAVEEEVLSFIRSDGYQAYRKDPRRQREMLEDRLGAIRLDIGDEMKNHILNDPELQGKPNIKKQLLQEFYKIEYSALDSDDQVRVEDEFYRGSFSDRGYPKGTDLSKLTEDPRAFFIAIQWIKEWRKTLPQY